MKFIRIIYFHVYSGYYKRGAYKNDIPHLTAFGIVATSLSFLAITLVNLIKYAVTKTKLSTEEYFAFVLICLFLFYFVFLHKGKYRDIYKSIKNSESDKLAVKILSWAIVLIGFVSFAASAFLFKNIQ